MARCVVFNGLPGSGKSTLAAQLVAGRQGWLALDIDVLRSMLGRAATDFEATGEEVRPLVAALVREQLRLGRDVVVPQLFFTAEGMTSLADAAGPALVHLMLDTDPGVCWERVQRRGSAPGASLVERDITRLIAERGGPAAMERMARTLATADFGDHPPTGVTGLDDVSAALGLDVAPR